MRLIKCRHAWHNLPAAFATVTNTTLKDIFKFCGHNGSGICWPYLPDPIRRAGFHTQEMVDYCLSRNYFCTPVAREFYTAREGVKDVATFDPTRLESRFHRYLRNYYGVLVLQDGIGVWNGEKIMAPWSGEVFDYTNQTIDLLFVVGRIMI